MLVVCGLQSACDKCTCDSYFCGLFLALGIRSVGTAFKPRHRQKPRQKDGTILFGLFIFLPLPIAETRTVCERERERVCAVSSVGVSAIIEPAWQAWVPQLVCRCALCVQCVLGFVELR